MLKRAAMCQQEAAIECVLRSVPQAPVQRHRGSASLGLPIRSYIRTPVLPARPNPRRADLGHRLGRRHVPDRCLHRRALHQTREVGEPERRSGLSPSSRLLPCGGRACSRGLSGTCKKPQPQLPSQGAVTVKVNAEVPGASGFASTSVWLRRANRLSETPLESMVSGTHEACPIGNRDCATRIPYCITLFSPTIVDEIPRLQV